MQIKDRTCADLCCHQCLGHRIRAQKTGGARVYCQLFLGVEASRQVDRMGRVENDPAVVDLILEVELTGLLFGDNVIGGTSTRRTPVATGILWREGSLHDGR
jgi:hypothetical protein